ncbi:hypothetical protein QQ045_000240 [Rhodiola kirilowii]
MNPNLVETMPVESGGDDAIAQLRRRSLKFFSNYFAVVPGRSQHHRRQIPASASHPSVASQRRRRRRIPPTMSSSHRGRCVVVAGTRSEIEERGSGT